MKSSVEKHDGIVVIHLNGVLDIGDGDVQLCQRIKEVCDEGFRNIIVDMDKVSYADSSGIGELVDVYLRLKEKGMRVCLARLHAKIFHLLALTRLVSVIPIFDSIEDAMLDIYDQPEYRRDVA